MKRKYSYIILLILLVNRGYGQPGSFSKYIFSATGDLNNDKLKDSAVVLQDTTAEERPYRLEIYFAQPGGKVSKVVSTDKMIEPQMPGGREAMQTGNEFSDITILKGVLSVNALLLRGHYEHKFRYQHGRFELIGFSMVSSNGQGEMESVDFNLSTGMRTEVTQRYDTDKLISRKKRKILIRPLPELSAITPLQSELY